MFGPVHTAYPYLSKLQWVILQDNTPPYIGNSIVYMGIYAIRRFLSQGSRSKDWTWMYISVCQLYLSIWIKVALYPGLLTPSFVACGTNAGKGLAKLIMCKDIPGCWVDVWRSGTFLLYSCKVAFWAQKTLPRLSDVKRSVILQSVVAISSALTYLRFFWECATPPHIHPTSRYVIACDQFHKAYGMCKESMAFKVTSRE